MKARHTLADTTLSKPLESSWLADTQDYFAFHLHGVLLYSQLQSGVSMQSLYGGGLKYAKILDLLGPAWIVELDKNASNSMGATLAGWRFGL